MEGLLRRLSGDGAEAEDALRVVMFFDRLTESRAGMDDLVRSCARLIGGSAGYTAAEAADDFTLAFDARGRRIDRPEGVVEAPTDARRRKQGQVWIAQDIAETIPLRDLILERFAIAAGVVVGRAGAPVRNLTSHHLLSAMSDLQTMEDRHEAARALGISLDSVVRVVIAYPIADSAAVIRQIDVWLKSHLGHEPQTALDDEGLIVGLVRDRGHGDDSSPIPDALIALGTRQPFVDAPTSYRDAKAALRLTSSELGPRLVDADLAGPAMQLALSAGDNREVPLVQRLKNLGQTDVGEGELLALDAFCRHRSVRTAASELHLHHSSLSYRLHKVASKLEINVTDPDDLLQATIALQLLRIARWQSGQRIQMKGKTKA